MWGDLTDEARVQEIAAQIRAKFGQIDILVNCAGGDIGTEGVTAPNAGKPEGNDAIHISLQDIRTVLDRNLMTCILCCREVAPEMMERKEGWIVNIGSIAGLNGNVTEAIYSTAKAAVHEYTRCLAALLRPYNVCVNVIAPGPIVTPRFLASRPTEDEMKVKGGTLDALWLADRGGARGGLFCDQRFVLYHRPGAPRRRRATDLACVKMLHRGHTERDRERKSETR